MTTTKTMTKQTPADDESSIKTNRVWIELERPKNDMHADRVVKLANNMLRRLNGGEPPPQQFAWSESRKCFMYGGPMGYSYQVDRGVWLSLDYLGRPL